MARGASGLLDGGFVFKLGRLFRTPYGGEGVDFVDQLNYQFTGGLMVIFIAIVSLRQYVGKPIQCWAPQEFTKSWEEYAENLCWVSNTYFLLPNESIPDENIENSKIRYIGYYQWVAIVMAGQAMMAWVPHLLWRVGSRRLPLLLKSAREAAIPDRELRLKAVSCLVATLEEQAESQYRFRRVKSMINRLMCGFSPNSRLTCLFLIVRMLFVMNSIGQIFLMQKFTGFNSTFFGAQLLQNLTMGEEWEQTGHFPRVTYCTVKIRKMGQIKMASYTLQCVLPINHFVEKIYVFLWFWFVLLAILTILNTISWSVNTILPMRRIHYIKQYLKALRLISSTEERDCTRFVNNNLGPDGIFILHVVSKIASDLIALDVTATLWKNFRQAKITGTEEDVNRLLEQVNRSTDDHVRSSGKSALHHKKERHLGSGGQTGGFSSAFHAAGPAFHSSNHQSHSSTGGGGSHDVMDATFIWKLTKLGRIGSSRLRFDDDFADRLNYQFTGVLMFLFIGLIGIRQYVGKPIQCWVPQVFTRGWEEYAENYCWVSNTYFSPVEGRLPAERDRISKQLGYYQWVPVMLAIQALLVYLPCLIWRLLMGYSGFNLRRIIQMACDSNLLLPEHTLKNVRFIARYMEGCIYRQRDYKRRMKGTNALTSSAYNSTNYTPFINGNGIQSPAYGVPPPQYSNKTPNGTFNNKENSNDTNDNLMKKIRMKSANSFKSFDKNEKFSTKTNEITVNNNGNALANGKTNRRTITKANRRKMSLLLCGRKYGNYLTVLYFTVKVIYLGNIIGQMYLMEKFIGANESYYGITILQNFIRGKDWQMTGNFPRITFCDFNAKKLGENDRYSIQCVLPLNMFLEKIYIFLWFWYCLVGIVTFGSFISWFLRMGFARRRIRFIRKYLKILSVMKETDKNATKKFVENYLRSDGVFIIRLIAINVGDFLAGDLVCELWHIYRHKQLQDLDDMKMTEADLQGIMGLSQDTPQFSQQNSILKHKLINQNSITNSLNNTNNNNNLLQPNAPPSFKGPPPSLHPELNKDISHNNDDSIV